MSQEPTVSSRLNSLKGFARQHPAAVLTVAGCVGYFAAHGYFTGRAQVLGVPFNFTPSTNGYVEVFLASAIFTVVSLAGILACGVADRISESKPSLGVAFGIGYIIFVVVFAAVALLVVSFRQWLFDLYEPLLPLLVYGLITCGAGWLSFRICKSMASTLLFAGIALIGLYLVMTFLGEQVEQDRTNWQIASTNNEHFIVAGHRGDLLMVAPLVSTSPPTYLKQFRYLDIRTPDLRLQKIEFEEMVREKAPRISLP